LQNLLESGFLTPESSKILAKIFADIKIILSFAPLYKKRIKNILN